MIQNIIAVGVGSCLGGIARYLVGIASKNIGGWEAYPIGTLAVNVVGCLILGAVFGLIGRGVAMTDAMKLFLTVGFCGGFTTFSTFVNENFLMLSGGRLLGMLVYTAVSVIMGLAATWLGYWATGD